MNEELTQNLNQLERRVLSRVCTLKKVIADAERMRAQEVKAVPQSPPQPQKVSTEAAPPQRSESSTREAPEAPAKVGLFRRVIRFFKRG